MFVRFWNNVFGNRMSRSLYFTITISVSLVLGFLALVDNVVTVDNTLYGRPITADQQLTLLVLTIIRVVAGIGAFLLFYWCMVLRLHDAGFNAKLPTYHIGALAVTFILILPSAFGGKWLSLASIAVFTGVVFAYPIIWFVIGLLKPKEGAFDHI